MRSIAFRFGLMMCAGFLILFLLMHSSGLSENYHFRILNAIIHVVFISLAIRSYRKNHPGEFNYLSGVATGMYTSAVGVLPFCVFMLIFLYIQPSFMQALQSNIPMAENFLTPITAALLILMEGLMVSLILSYIVMRIVESYRPAT